jgi:hypothetical protein
MATRYKILSILILVQAIVLSGCGTAAEPQTTPFKKQVSTSTAAEPVEEMEATDQAALPTQQEDGLSVEGPWIVFKTADGIWGLNSNGTGLTQLYSGHIVAPSDLRVGYSSPNLAFITASDPLTLQDLTLQIITIPLGKVMKSIPLSTPENDPDVSVEICDPKYEAARAATIANGLAWNRQGNKLAFVARINGPTSDLYLYDAELDQISQLSDGPSQAYGVNWSASGDFIIHFGASCFGTGAGFQMDGVWAARSDQTGMVSLYEPEKGSFNELFLGNYWSNQDAYYATSSGECPYQDLRLIEIEDRQITMVHEGCFWDYDLGPTGLIAVLSNEIISEQPGLSIYMERDGEGEFPLFGSMPLDGGQEVIIQGPTVFVQYWDESGSGPQVVSYNISEGTSGWYQGSGEIPTLGPGAMEELYAWQEGEKLYLVQGIGTSPRLLTDRGARNLFWFDDIQDGTIYNRLIYVEKGSPEKLYMISSPDFQPHHLADGLEPRGDFLLLY